MSELRKDPITGRWVIIATERGKRPSDFQTGTTKKTDKDCPLCEGKEANTPSEILSKREIGTAPNEPGWQVRVVPSKNPLLVIEGDLNRSGIGLYDMMEGIGAHEIIVETPEHITDISELPVEQIALAFDVYIERMESLRQDQRFKYMLLFKNHGEQSGGELDHTHSNLIALPIVPKTVKKKLEGSISYFEYKSRCIFCDILHHELTLNERVVVENDFYVAITPFASRFPFEVWILPKEHQARFVYIDEKHRRSLAFILKEVLTRLNRALDLPPYNYLINTLPVNSEYTSEFHWHLEILPRLTRMAGFEWGTGFFINPTTPEDAAMYLKEVKE